MKSSFDTYFAGELNPQEKEEFLSEVINDTKLREEFIANQHLMAFTALLHQEDDEQHAQQSLFDFLSKTR